MLAADVLAAGDLQMIYFVTQRLGKNHAPVFERLASSADAAPSEVTLPVAEAAKLYQAICREPPREEPAPIQRAAAQCPRLDQCKRVHCVRARRELSNADLIRFTCNVWLRYSRGRALQSLADRPWPPRLILCFSGYRQASGGAGSRAPVRPWVPQSSAQFRDSSLKCELKEMN